MLKHLEVPSIVVCNLGGEVHKIRHIIYENIQMKYGINLDIRLKNMKEKAKSDGLSKTKINNMNILDVISKDNNLVNAYLNEIITIAKKHNINIILEKIS